MVSRYHKNDEIGYPCQMKRLSQTYSAHLPQLICEINVFFVWNQNYFHELRYISIHLHDAIKEHR